VQAAWRRPLSGLIFPLLLASPALAQSSAPAAAAAPDCPEQDATICGRRHFESGTQAFEKGDFNAAAAAFQLALSERPHPVIRFNLGLTFARLGRPSAAIEQLKQVETDPAADKQLRERAEREERSAAQALARITFRLNDPTRESVELDGAAVQLAEASALSLDPGTHHVRVISGSSVVLDQELELAPGERVELRVGERSRRIDVVVVPDPTQLKPIEKKPAPALAPMPVPRPAPDRLSPVWFYAGAGATLALAGLTVWSGLDTQSALADYRRDLPHLSQGQADARVHDGHSRELRTNLLLGGSLLCGAGSAVLGIWFVDFSDHKRASLALAPSMVTLRATF